MLGVFRPSGCHEFYSTESRVIFTDLWKSSPNDLPWCFPLFSHGAPRKPHKYTLSCTVVEGHHELLKYLSLPQFPHVEKALLRTLYHISDKGSFDPFTNKIL